MAKDLVPEFSHQSCAIEQNRLSVEDSVLISKRLDDRLFGMADLASLPSSQLNVLQLPTPSELLPDKDPNLVAELRNQIVTSTWIIETAPQLQKSSGLGESDIQSLAALMIKDTVSKKLHSCGWGGRSTPGDLSEHSNRRPEQPPARVPLSPGSAGLDGTAHSLAR
jgi:hypothetical protein